MDLEGLKSLPDCTFGKVYSNWLQENVSRYCGKIFVDIGVNDVTDLSRLIKMAIQSSVFQTASEQRSHWLIKSPTKVIIKLGF